MNISVIGTGYVGSVSGACLADFGNNVVCVDRDAAKIEALKNGVIPLFEPGLDEVICRNVRTRRLRFSTDLAESVRDADAVFIAVGTPPTKDGSADLRYVEAAAREIGRNIVRYTVVVDKSTVPIGTGRKVAGWIQEELSLRDGNAAKTPFDVVSNPEFLREGAAVYDFTHPDRVVIGASNEKARAIMKEIYRPLYLNETPYIETDLESAEMIKYASNAFLAMKITFINEIANLCEKCGANVKDAAKAIGRDGRIGGKFLHPGPGYGGSCFPKDTAALAQIARTYGETLSLVEATIAANERQKTRMVDKIIAELGGEKNVTGRTVAILGLAFKQNTDDMRESPAIAICEGLAAKGVRLRVFDPEAMREAEWRLASIRDSVIFCADEYTAAEGASATVIVTPWNQFRNLDLARLKTAMRGDVSTTLPRADEKCCFFDLRNIYKRADVESAGFAYFGVGM
ncbi:MAG: UDP-glucose/GDP-mannose dehydrogenase family protein [Treponema sp.]|jgi:UDPglucose 6-dehydrogenase|nr:UDP-glucose/GDP-mannose dehydrogenase family protein [Treponema sp.]